MAEALGKSNNSIDWSVYFYNQAMLYYRYMQETHQQVTIHTPAMRLVHFAEFLTKDNERIRSKIKK